MKSSIRRLPAQIGSPDFVRLWAGGTVSYFGTAVTTVALPIVALETLQATTFQVGLVSASGLIAWLLFGLEAGVWIEGTARRRLLIACDLIRAAALLSVPLAAVTGVLSIAQLALVALVVGVASVFFDIASQTYLPSIVGKNELLSGNSKLQASQSAALAGGPAAGGAFVQLLGAPLTLLVDVSSYLFSAACLFAVKQREATLEHDRSTRIIAQVRQGIAYVLQDPAMRTLTLVAAGVNLLGTGFETLLIPFLLRTVRVSPALIGVLVALGGIGGIIGAAMAARFARQFGVDKALLISALAGPLLAMLVPLTVPGPGLLLFAAGVLGIEGCVAVLSLLTRSYRQAATPPELLARVTATYRFLSWGVRPVGALAGGALGQWVGNRAALWVVCTAFLLTPVPIVSSWLRRGSLLSAAGDALVQPGGRS
jgi:MFS family permease